MGKTTLNWAIVAPGKIAEKFAESISSIAKKDNSIACYAVASRTKEKAQAFAEKWGFKKAYGSYEELFADPEADVVYIANPHPFHAELALHALAAGKHVLVEKPAAVNVQSLQQVIDFAQEKKLFFMEAFWTSCNPTVLDVLDLIRSGAIGSVTQANVNFCFRNRYDAASRLFNPELAGGALLDVGIYPLTFAMMVAHATDDMQFLQNAPGIEPLFLQTVQHILNVIAMMLQQQHSACQNYLPDIHMVTLPLQAIRCIFLGKKAISTKQDAPDFLRLI